MKTIIAQNNWFAESDLRLDASFHLSDTNRLKLIYKKSPFQFSTIEKQAQIIFSGNIFKRIYVSDPDRGTPYITGSDMIKSEIDSGRYLSKKQVSGLQNLMLKKGWILVSCSGTLGNTVYTNELFEGRIATHDLIRIIPNNKDVKEGFLYAYLSSKYGYTLLTQSSYGGVVKHIEPHHIANISVPIFPNEIQQQIHNLITESAELRVNANKILEDTEGFFYNYLNIKHSTANKFQTGTRKISEIQNNFQLRFDAPIFIKQGVKLIDALKKKVEFGFELLGNCETKVSRPGIFKRIYVKNKASPTL
jgi:type I restriction enzyme, S subunit